MNKPLVAFSLACACALAFADNAQWQSSRFTGIGTGVTALDSLNTKATGGAWNVQPGGLTTENAAISDGKLVLDLDDGETAAFTVSQEAGDTGTLQTIAIKAVFTPVTPTDILSGAAMNAKKAQVGFAIVNTEGTTYKYYAWVGATGGTTTPLADWVELSGTPTPNDETEAQIEIDHWDATPYAVFKVKVGGGYVTLADAADSALTNFVITSTAKTAASVSSVACSGSGSLSALDGAVQLGVASIGDRKYPTADAAIQAATSGQTVSLNRDLAGDVEQMPGTVTAKDGVKIADNGHRASIDASKLPENSKVEVTPAETDIKKQTEAGGSGTYVIGTAVDPAKVVITLPASISQYKQVKSNSLLTLPGGGVQYELETADACLPGKEANRSKMRAFLSSQRNAVYTQAESSLSAINTALAENAGNGLSYQQCYELGVAATDSVQPVAVANDTDAENITLEIPAIGKQEWAGAYDITYSIKTEDGDVIKTEDGDVKSGLTSPKIPLEAGNGKFKVVAVATEK